MNSMPTGSVAVAARQRVSGREGRQGGREGEEEEEEEEEGEGEEYTTSEPLIHTHSICIPHTPTFYTIVIQLNIYLMGEGYTCDRVFNVFYCVCEMVGGGVADGCSLKSSALSRTS